MAALRNGGPKSNKQANAWTNTDRKVASNIEKVIVSYLQSFSDQSVIS